MKLRTNWHATWTPWVQYYKEDCPYLSRKRQLYLGRMLLATLVQSTLRPKEPFFMYTTGARDLTVRGTNVFRVVRAFMRQLR